MNNNDKLIKSLYIIVGILSFVFVGLGVNYYTSTLATKQARVESDPIVKKSEESKSEDENFHNKIDSGKEKLYNIGLTETEFRQRFNQVADTELSELDLHISKDYVYTGDYANVYSVPFDNTTSLTLSYEPNSEFVRGVLLSGQPVTDNETILFIGAIANIVATLNPDLSPAGRKELLQKLGMFNGRHTDYKTINSSTYRNNIHYNLRGTGGNGVAFIAVAKDIGTEAGSSVRRDEPHNIMADVTNYIVWDRNNQINMREQPSQQEKNNSSDESLNNTYAEIDAQSVLREYHKNITYKRYKEAYSFLTNELQGRIPYDGWANGFRTTVSSSVSDIKTASKSPNKIVLTYRLQAEDNPGGIKKFSGTVVMVKVGGAWKINDITNKKI